MPARKALYAILLCAFSAAAHAARIGEWTVFPAYKNATRNVVAGEWVYSLSSSNLYRYHAATGEVQLFSRQNGLNDAGISHIDYCRAEKCLVIVYENANIDLLYDNGDVTNIPQLRDSELADKAVNNLDVEGSQAYIALSGGVEVVDVAEAVLANYYAVGHTLSTTVFDGKLYASTTGGILCGRLTDNLLDSRNWGNLERQRGFLEMFPEAAAGFVAETPAHALLHQMVSCGIDGLFLAGEDNILEHLNILDSVLPADRPRPVLVTMENPSISRFLNPPLTTVAQPFPEMVRFAAELISEQILEKQPKAILKIFPNTLIRR